MVRLPDGFALTGEQSEGGIARDIRVMRVDDAGDVVWDRTYGGPGWDGGRNIRVLADGDLIVSGELAGEGWIARLRIATGDVVWERTFPALGADLQLRALAVSEAGWILVGGSSWIDHFTGYVAYLLSPDGETLGTIRAEGPQHLERAIALPDEGIALFGGLRDPSGFRGGGAWLRTLRCAPLLE